MQDRVDWVDVAKGICIMHRGDDAFHARRGEGGGRDRLDGLFRRVRAALPHARLLPHRRPLPGEPHQRALAALSRPQGAAFRLFLRALAHHPVRLQGARLRRRDGLGGVVREYLYAFIEPWGTLWFIYHLALFLLVTRLLKNVPWLLVWGVAAALEIAPIHTGSVLIDEFASRFVYFYSGYVFATCVFRLADEAARRPRDDADGACALGGAQRASSSSTATATGPSSAWRSALPARSPSSRRAVL